MLDLLPTVPYYTGYLCAALKGQEQVRVNMGCPTYRLDRCFFQRQKLRKDSALLDAVFRFRTLPARLRRSLKVIEYLTNMGVLLLRFGFSKPDVLHVQFLPMVKFGVAIEIWFLRMVRARGTRIVYTVHNVLPQDSGEKHRSTFRKIYHSSDRLICHDDSAKSRLVREFEVAEERISVIPHGPLHEPSSAAGGERLRQKLGLGPDECMVLCQGILRHYKGVPFLLQAWGRLSPPKGRARLAIVGNGDASIVKEIRDEVESLGLRDSILLDFRFVSVEEMADYGSAADVLVYPYREITSSGALMTGIRYGRAIVATDQPVFREILRPGENALIVQYGDVEGLASELSRLINDASLRRNLGDQAHKTALSGPQWPAIAHDTVACYRAAMLGERK
jgi:glycosyltransferase involved in cell wall biosynthesis